MPPNKIAISCDDDKGTKHEGDERGPGLGTPDDHKVAKQGGSITNTRKANDFIPA
jgi:hypothetical protein